jgi:hypothetical protein
MPRLPLRCLATVLALVPLLPAAGVEPVHALGRHHGIGWSDGYHSRAACPRRYYFGHHRAAPSATSFPWWTAPTAEPLPAAESELLPAPTGQSPATSRTFPPAGPSLFRQPGEGSAVPLSSAPGSAANR